MSRKEKSRRSTFPIRLACFWYTKFSGWKYAFHPFMIGNVLTQSATFSIIVALNLSTFYLSACSTLRLYGASREDQTIDLRKVPPEPGD